MDAAGYGFHDGRVDVPALPVEGEFYGGCGELHEVPACELFGALRFGNETPGDTGADGARIVRGGGNVDGGALGEGFFSLQTYFLFNEDSRYVLHEVFAVVFDDGGTVELFAAYALGPAG